MFFRLFNNENINVLKTDKNFTKYDNIRSLNQIGASKGIAYKIKKYFFRNSARILVIGSWINKIKLFEQQFIKNNITYFDIRWVEFKLRKSEKLILIDEDDSQLDMFISECLNYLLPESIFIDFDYYEKLLDREINTRKLKYILSEKWLNCDMTPLIVSLLKEKGIKHITTQHGYQQLSMYNFLSVQSICSDILLTQGWNSNEYNNLESLETGKV